MTLDEDEINIESNLSLFHDFYLSQKVPKSYSEKHSTPLLLWYFYSVAKSESKLFFLSIGTHDMIHIIWKIEPKALEWMISVSLPVYSPGLHSTFAKTRFLYHKTIKKYIFKMVISPWVIKCTLTVCSVDLSDKVNILIIFKTQYFIAVTFIVSVIYSELQKYLQLDE